MNPPPPSAQHADNRPNFAAAVPDDGYVWWYIDALSDDRAHGLTIIAMLGSVFSPWYAWARRSGPTPALNHCAMNVALYGAGGHRWAMTERNATSLDRTTTHLAIGPSALRWEGDCLVIDIEEVTAPIPTRLRGQVRLHPTAIAQHVVALDAVGRHGWSPIAPTARVEVAMSQPARAWAGDAYMDCNWGSRPLEADFTGWTWSRARIGGGTAVLYDTTRRDGTHATTALRYAADGTCAPFPAPPVAPLAPTFWRLPRQTRSDGAARVLATCEDAPFYARSMIHTELLGEKTTAMHEALSLTRFDTPWMRLMLPFKAPRAVLKGGGLRPLDPHRRAAGVGFAARRGMFAWGAGL